jgi:hypothetical protein
MSSPHRAFCITAQPAQQCLDARKSAILYQDPLYTPPRVFLCRKKTVRKTDETDDDEEDMRKELLQRLDQKSKNHVITNGVASFPSLETAPMRLRKKPPGSPSRSRKRKRR